MSAAKNLIDVLQKGKLADPIKIHLLEAIVHELRLEIANLYSHLNQLRDTHEARMNQMQREISKLKGVHGA